MTIWLDENGHWGTTPLHAAAHGNQRHVAKVLLERGADKELKNLGGQTPYQETFAHNATAVRKLLEEFPKRPPQAIADYRIGR